jgi:hypothetical protein
VTSKNHTAVLTYASPLEAMEVYRPKFEASARATTGLVAPSAIPWRRIAMIVLMSVVASVWIAMEWSKRSQQKASIPPPAHSAAMWDCPSCKRRVPLRVDTCRCGAAKPA